MSSTELMLPAERLRRVQRLYPGAIGQGWAHGLKYQTRGEVRRMERTGEIIAVHRFAKELNGQVSIPYVRMKTRAQVHREQAKRVALMAGAGTLFLAAVAWMAWDARYVIATAAGLALASWLLIRLVPHWTNGCPGLHCPGCKG
jgi:hypothetical protein